MTQKGEVEQQSRVRALRDKGSATVVRVRGSVAARYWSQLTAVDFMNSSMYFAALCVLCLFPFFAVTTDLAGRNVATGIITRMGLNPQAAQDVHGLIAPTHQAVASLTVFSIVWLVFGPLAIAATMQEWYQKVYDQPPSGNAILSLAYRAGWFVGLVGYSVANALIGKLVGRSGGQVPIFVIDLVVAVLFWWFSAHLLLRGRVRWRHTLPTGVATGICVTGLALFSSLFFSSSIISGENNYGPVGIISVLLSYLIGWGVCVHLGAVFGRMWSERHAGVATGPYHPNSGFTDWSGADR
jgi:membrane protein